jgi:hypothetical protein
MTKALCLGGASCVWDDLLEFESQYGHQWDGLVIAANDVGAHWPRKLDHWVSLHADKIPKWLALRAKHGFPVDGITTWGKLNKFNAAPDTVKRGVHPWAGGSSGMLAVQVARELGCTRIVLCGIPMSRTPHFRETKERFHTVWLSASGHWRAWHKEVQRMTDYVRSMSGNTRTLLGAPTREWLNEIIE